MTDFNSNKDKILLMTQEIPALTMISPQKYTPQATVRRSMAAGPKMPNGMSSYNLKQHQDDFSRRIQKLPIFKLEDAAGMKSRRTVEHQINRSVEEAKEEDEVVLGEDESKDIRFNNNQIINSARYHKFYD